MPKAWSSNPRTKKNNKTKNTPKPNNQTNKKVIQIKDENSSTI
jgi:hypothetical protein